MLFSVREGCIGRQRSSRQAAAATGQGGVVAVLKTA
jgi:hypothetical protein